jgi:hypothetical protein
MTDPLDIAPASPCVSDAGLLCLPTHPTMHQPARCVRRIDGGGWVLCEEPPPGDPESPPSPSLLRSLSAPESRWADAYAAAQRGILSPMPLLPPPASLYRPCVVVDEVTAYPDPLSFEGDPATWADPKEDAPARPGMSPSTMVGAGRVLLRVLSGGGA